MNLTTENSATLIETLRRVAHFSDDDENEVIADAKIIADRLFYTAYMPCDQVSSQATRRRAKDLAQQIGSQHIVAGISMAVAAIINVFRVTFGIHSEPCFKAYGGSNVENLAIQNVQARVQMIVGYLIAQLAPWAHVREGALLVLAGSNVDENMRGYYTEYDCSAADINLIGGISKLDLHAFLKWAASEENPGLSSLKAVIEAKSTAKLEPLNAENEQIDEVDMGMTYEELSLFGRLRMLNRCGPVPMFRKLCSLWRDSLGVEEIQRKVQFFFRMYGMNRHKVTTLTPSYHAENYSPEDNRFDLRPFLYNRTWRWLNILKEHGDNDRRIARPLMKDSGAPHVVIKVYNSVSGQSVYACVLKGGSIIGG